MTLILILIPISILLILAGIVTIDLYKDFKKDWRNLIMSKPIIGTARPLPPPAPGTIIHEMNKNGFTIIPYEDGFAIKINESKSNE